MRSKSVILLALALGCGLVASIGISQVMERRNANVPTPGETEAVFVALTDINPNDPITPQNIKLEEWPKGKVPPGTLRTLEEVEGKRGRIKLFAGEPLLAAKVMGANEVQGATPHIPKGYRVVAVRVDNVSGGANLILPGDRVDVLVFLSKNESLGVLETSTRTILQDVKIFAVDTLFQRQPDHDEPTIAAKTISLLVTPQQAEKVTLATEMGTIRLILRNQDDNVASTSEGAKVSDVVGGESADREAEVRKPQASPTPSSNLASGAKSLLDLIKQQKETVQAAPKSESAGPWKMKMISGADVSEVEIGGNELPTVVGTETPPTSAPAEQTESLNTPTDTQPTGNPPINSGTNPESDNNPLRENAASINLPGVLAGRQLIS
jgi:pilus assembly protein CpaB